MHEDKSDCVKSTIHARFNPGNHTQLWYNICMQDWKPHEQKEKKNTVAVMYTYKGISWHVTSCKHYNIDSSLARAVLLKNSRNEHSITRFDMEHRGALL